MAAVAVALSSPAGRPCTSPSTITPASPSPACCPTRPLTPPSPSYVPHSPSMPSTAFPFAACSPITDLAIAPIAFAPPARNWAYVIASHALTRHAPTVRPNASSKLLFASGLTSATTPTPKNAISSFPPGCTTTTSPVPMVASVTLHLSAELLRKVQPLEGSQPPGPNRGYSELPRCSLPVGVILPNIPSFSSLGPAVKNSSVARPLLVLSPPKLSAHSPSIHSGLPVGSRSVPSNLPLTPLNACMCPSPKLPISRRWLNGPKSPDA